MRLWFSETLMGGITQALFTRRGASCCCQAWGAAAPGWAGLAPWGDTGLPETPKLRGGVECQGGGQGAAPGLGVHRGVHGVECSVLGPHDGVGVGPGITRLPRELCVSVPCHPSVMVVGVLLGSPRQGAPQMILVVPWAWAVPHRAPGGYLGQAAPTVASPPCHCHHTGVAARAGGSGISLGCQCDPGGQGWGAGGRQRELGAWDGAGSYEEEIRDGNKGSRSCGRLQWGRGAVGARMGYGAVWDQGQGFGVMVGGPGAMGTVAAGGVKAGGSTSGLCQPCTHICAQLCPQGPCVPCRGAGARGRGAGCAGGCGEGGCVPAPRDGQDEGLLLRLGGCAVASGSFSAPSSSRRNPLPVPGGRWSWGGWGCEGGTLWGCPADPLSFPFLPLP